MDKNVKILLTQAVAGAAIGLFLRKKMADNGMIKSFWSPCMIRKPGTYPTTKCKVCDEYVEPAKYKDEFGVRPTKEKDICSWGCLHHLANNQ